MSRFWQAFESLALFAIVPLVLLNLLGAIVSGIWLMILAEWSDIVSGVFLLIFSPILLGLVLMPTLPLGAKSLDYASRGSTFGFTSCSTLGLIYTYGVVISWCAIILVYFVSGATATNLIPKLIWSYTFATGVFSYMASKDPQDVGGSIQCLITQFSFGVVILLLVFTSITILNAIEVFVACMVLALVAHISLLILMRPLLCPGKASPGSTDFSNGVRHEDSSKRYTRGSVRASGVGNYLNRLKNIARSTRILARVWIGCGAAFTAFCIVIFLWIGESPEHAGRLTFRVIDELLLFALLPVICAAVLLRNSKQGWIACVIYSCWTLAGVAVGVTAWAFGLHPETPISPVVDHLRWLLIAALLVLFLIARPLMSFSCWLLVLFLVTMFPFGFAFAPEITYFTFLRAALALPSLILLGLDRPSRWRMASVPATTTLGMPTERIEAAREGDSDASTV